MMVPDSFLNGTFYFRMTISAFWPKDPEVPNRTLEVYTDLLYYFNRMDCVIFIKGSNIKCSKLRS